VETMPSAAAASTTATITARPRNTALALTPFSAERDELPTFGCLDPDGRNARQHVRAHVSEHEPSRPKDRREGAKGGSCQPPADPHRTSSWRSAMRLTVDQEPPRTVRIIRTVDAELEGQCQLEPRTANPVCTSIKDPGSLGGPCKLPMAHPGSFLYTEDSACSVDLPWQNPSRSSSWKTPTRTRA
jgi:hypothetical protein